MKGSPHRQNKWASKKKNSQICPKKEDKHPGTESIDHSACMINGSFANDTNESELAGKRMGNICKEVHQLCMYRRKSSCISNCPIRKCSRKSRSIVSIFQALIVHFCSNYQLEHLIGLHPFFPHPLCNAVRMEVKFRRNEGSFTQQCMRVFFLQRLTKTPAVPPLQVLTCAMGRPRSDAVVSALHMQGDPI